MGICVLIVDDEAHIRAGIKAKLNWEQFGVDCLIDAGDGVEALDLAHKKMPDIIISDIRMPEYDGLSLIQDLYEQGHAAKIIIISGYADFEYAKRAMTYGVKSYLLKPIEPDQLKKEVSQLIEDIHNAKQKDEEWAQLRNKYENSLKQSLDQQFTDFLYEPSQAIRILPKLNEAGFADYEGNFVVAALKIKPFDLERLDFRYRFSLEDKDLFMFCVKNMIQDLIQFPKPYHFFKNVRKSHEFVFLFYIDNDFSLPSMVKSQLENIIVKIKEYLKIESAAAIGEKITLADHYTKGYRQACQALSETIVRGYGKVYIYTELRESLKHIHVLGESERQMLFMHLEQGNSVSALRSIDAIFIEMSRSNNFNYDYFRNICMDIIIILKGFIAQRHLKEEMIWGDSSEMFDLMNESDSMEEAVRYLKQTFEMVIHNTQKKKQISGEDIVGEAMQFMQSNYHQKISLQMISEKYFIHAGYFSRIFKDIVGRNFNEYLTNIRINKACELLLRTDSTITTISEIVGFDEPKYFSKVFKKGMGITPSEYLETLQEVKGRSYNETVK